MNFPPLHIFITNAPHRCCPELYTYPRDPPGFTCLIYAASNNHVPKPARSNVTRPANPQPRRFTGHLPSSHASASALQLGISILTITPPHTRTTSITFQFTVSVRPPMRTPRWRMNEAPRNFYSNVDPFSPTSQLSGLVSHASMALIFLLDPPIGDHSPKGFGLDVRLDFGHSFSTISSVTNPAHPHLHRHWRLSP